MAEPTGSATSRPRSFPPGTPPQVEEEREGAAPRAGVPGPRSRSASCLAISGRARFTPFESVSIGARVTAFAGDRARRLWLIVWALILVVAVKYVSLIMRADNHGEGGILALLALAQEAARPPARGNPRSDRTRRRRALLRRQHGHTGDFSLERDRRRQCRNAGVVPVCGADEVVVLVLLFLVQRRGTASVGRLFGPVMLLWFAVIGMGWCTSPRPPGFWRHSTRPTPSPYSSPLR